MFTVEKGWNMTWTTQSKYQELAIREAYHGYIWFLTNEIQFVEIRNKLTVSVTSFLSDIVSVKILDCTKLHSFHTNQKRKGRLGKWNAGDAYDLCYIYIGQYKFINT